MLQVTEIAFTCYPVTDMARARNFYEGVLGLKPTASGCSVGLEVEDFDAAITHLKASDVKFKMEPFPTPVCRMAFIFDPDGNTICIHKRNAGHH